MAGEKVIILTTNNRLCKALLQSVRKKNLEYESENISLYDMKHITRMVRTTKNTLFLREAFGNFIKENNGTPLCIVIDYKIDFGLPRNLDPDNMKLLKTFLVSSVILTDKTNLTYNVTNLVLISSPQNLKQLDMFKANPYLAYKIVKTENQQVNQLLEKAAGSAEKGNSLFSIDYLLIDESNDTLSAAHKLEVILDNLLKKKQSLMNLKKTEGQTEIISGKYEAAKILYKISDARLYLDGKVFNIENNDKFEKYKEDVIYILGYYIQNNVNQVNEKLEKFILEDLPRLRNISIDTEINISLNSHTIIDGGIAPALNILLSIKLKDFKNIHLITSPVNFKKIEKSPGFISLRNYIIKRL